MHGEGQADSDRWNPVRLAREAHRNKADTVCGNGKNCVLSYERSQRRVFQEQIICIFQKSAVQFVSYKDSHAWIYLWWVSGQPSPGELILKRVSSVTETIPLSELVLNSQ